MSNDLDLGDLKITLECFEGEPVRAVFDMPNGSSVARNFPGNGELTMRLGLGLGLNYRSLTSAPALAISGTPVTTATEDAAYAGFTVTASGGDGSYTYSLVGTWPDGITVDSATGEVSGTPTESGTFASLSVRVTDGASATADLDSFALEVEAAANGPITSFFNTGARGDRTASITASITGSLGAGTINNLIDGAFGATSSDACWFSGGQTSVIVKFDFGTAKVIDAFRWLQSTTASHGTWVFEGSNDDSSYTQIGSNFTLGGANLTFFFGANTTAYRYYRLRQTSGSTSSSPWLQEIEFRIAAAGDPERSAIEYGDRTSLITVATAATISSGTIDNLVDGSYADDATGGVILTGGQSLREIEFDLGAGNAEPFTGFQWLQTATSSHGTWVAEGTNDRSTYTQLGTSFTLGGALISGSTWANSTPYRIIRFRQTSGTTSGGSRILEVEFKI